LRVLVVGDSLGIDLGDSLVNDLANTGVVTATLDGKESTGLTGRLLQLARRAAGDLPSTTPRWS